MSFLTERHIEDFNNLIGYDTFIFLDEYYEFFQDDYPKIVSFFSGNLDSLGEEVLRNYDNLVKSNEKILEAIRDRNKFLTAYVHWELVEHFDNLRENLKDVRVLWKYLRSSKTSFNYKNTLDFDHVLGKNETIEDLSSSVNGEDNYQNQWQDIALRNDLSELDYTTEGGEKVILSINLNTTVYPITSILDSPIGKNILGRDVSKEMRFVDNNILVLGYDDTYYQSVDTMLSLKKGQVPEFRFLGRDVLVGSNLRTFGVAVLTRQLQQIFSTDDSVNNIRINKISLEGSVVYIELLVESNFKNIVKQQLNL